MADVWHFLKATALVLAVFSGVALITGLAAGVGYLIDRFYDR